MKWKDEDLPALQELESAVLGFWRRQPELTNYAAMRAYEAAHQLYRDRARGHEPKPVALTGPDLELFHTIQPVCEKLLSTGAAPMRGMSASNTAPVSVEKLAQYLRELHRSVERHTELGGRRGYFEFLERFIPRSTS
jgi:hypothetical protein